MVIPGKPQWLIEREESEMDAINRKVGRILQGRQTPPEASIIEKMKKEYSRYGKNRGQV